MPIVTLDANVVKNAVCPKNKKKLDLYDTEIKGFMVEVRISGGKTFWFRYRDSQKKLRQQKIGDAKAISIQKARQVATQMRARTQLGESLVGESPKVSSVPTLEEFAWERYMPYLKGYKRSWITDDGVLRNHLLPKFGKKRLNEITHEEVVAFHHAQRASGFAPATVNRFIIILRYAYRLAKKWNVPGAEENPAAGVKMFEENNQRERFLTTDESKILIEMTKKSKNKQLQYIVPLLLLLGCRKNELLRSTWDQFDLDRRFWKIPMSKSGRSRTVPLSKAAIKILHQVPRWEGCSYVVPNPKTKKPFCTIHDAWNIVRNRAGLHGLRLHDLRHSHASFLVNGHRSIYEVQKILGHSQIETTQRYAHLSQDTLLEAVDTVADIVGL